MNKKDKIAIFTDAHGLLEPTEAVLKDMQKKKIDRIYSLGDNIGLGPNPKEVMHLLNDYEVISLCGEYEEYINLSYVPFKSYLDFEEIENLYFTKNELTMYQIKQLKCFPKFIDISVNRKK